MADDKRYLTQEKYDEFVKELEELKHDKRKEIAENLEYAKSLGDLSENAEYQEAREAQAELEERIRYIENTLKNAEIISDHGTDVVTVGSEIVVQKDGAGEKINYTLVGSEEANISEGKISIRSPFGEAVLGKKKGDEFSFETPGGKMSYTIVSIK